MKKLSSCWNFIRIPLVAIGVFFICTGHVVQAQTSSNAVFFEISPEIPSAFETVSLKVKSYSIDIDAAYINWIVDGKKVLTGTGKKEFTIKAKDTGQNTVIVVGITPKDGIYTEKTITIQPQGLDLLWQTTDAYVPPFYKGKALPGTEGAIKIVAIPDIQKGQTLLKPDQFVYKWKNNFTLIPESSGYNKQSYSFFSSYFNDQETISAEVGSISGSYKAEKTIIIKTAPPKIVFYKKDTGNFGQQWNALTRSTPIPSNLTVLTVPYFFSTKSPNNGQLIYNWTLNQKPVSGDFGNELPIEVDSSTGEGIRINLSIEHKTRLFQKTTSDLKVNLIQ